MHWGIAMMLVASLPERFWISCTACLVALVVLAGCGEPSDPGMDPPLEEPACSVAPTTYEHGAGTPADTIVHKLDPARYPAALCNDGSPGAYFLRPGFGPGARRLLLYLEGGGHCGAAAECAARFRGRRDLMSSEPLVDGAVIPRMGEGFKSIDPTENPDFYDATFVQVHYCSSDLWTGDVAAVAGAPLDQMTRWHFRGRAIVDAVLSELATRGLAEATEVLFVGSSAGGVGVINLADDLRARLPSSTRMLVAADAGFIIEYPAYDRATQRESEVLPSPEQLHLVAAAQAWGGRGDQGCEAAATSDLERAACRLPSLLLAGDHVEVPVFVRQSQLDPVQIRRLIDPEDTSAPAQAFRERFGARMREVLAALGPRYSVHSSHDALHGIIGTTDGWTVHSVGGVVVRDAVGSWAKQPCPASRVLAP